MRLGLPLNTRSKFVERFLPNRQSSKIDFSSNTTHQEWEERAHEMVDKTSREINSSKPLRSFIDIALKQTIDDIANQVSRTSEAFKRRIADNRYAKTILEGVHKRTAEKINDIQQNIAQLDRELAEKEGFVTLCQMRLSNRAHRPGPELCRDKVQDTLTRELHTLQCTSEKLSQMIAEVRFRGELLGQEEESQSVPISISVASHFEVFAADSNVPRGRDQSQNELDQAR